MLRHFQGSLRPLRPLRLHRGLEPLRFVRFQSKGPKKPNLSDSKSVSKPSNSSLSQTSSSNTSKSAPAPLTTGLGLLLKKDTKPYVPKLKHQRLTYEYPGLPNEDDFSKSQRSHDIPSRWSRYFPKIAIAVVVVWAAYSIKVWVYPSEESASNDLLDPNEFHKFIVTHKEDIDADHFLIEVTPKHQHWQYSYYANYDKKCVWNGDRIWSVDVKQPHIMVVRQYTPLPLYFMKSEYTHSGEKKPLLRVVNNDAEDSDKQGVMCFYVKKYNDGEVSKYIASKKIGDELELRGPNIEYRFPYHPLKDWHTRPIFRDLPSKVEPEPFVENIKKAQNLPDFDNLVFYAAGTGIAPALQVLLSRNPYRGYTEVHYSARTKGEIKPLERLLFFLEKLDRVKFIPHYDTEPTALAVKKPKPTNYTSLKRIEQADLSPDEALKLRLKIMNGEHDEKHQVLEKPPHYENAIEQAMVTSRTPKSDASLAIVCGPDGYVEYVAGRKIDATAEQGEVKGLLGQKGWDSSNVYKL